MIASVDGFRQSFFLVFRNPTNFKAYSGRALAYEGLAEWDNAVQDYTKALEQAQLLTGYVEPYIINSRGNAFASLGQYQDALQDYLLSVQVTCHPLYNATFSEKIIVLDDKNVYSIGFFFVALL